MDKNEKIDQILTRGVEKIYPSKKALENFLRSGEKLTLYNGIDPSGDKLHLGHSVVLQKLKQFQNLGHKVILLIGDFTGMIGDPSDRASTRKQLTRSQVLENAKNYQKEASKILDFEGPNPVELKFNSNWLAKLTLEQVIELMTHVTYQQLIERDMFQERIKKKQPIFFHELIYPLLQGYDSVAMDVDLEVGGSDQTFNMLAGRQLVKDYLKKQKFVLTTPLISDKQGRKLGKSEGNAINFKDESSEMYGKVMNFPDEVILQVFECCTEIPTLEIKNFKKELEKGINPMDIKKILAKEIVQMYHGKKEAEKAKSEFEKVIQKGKLPSKIPEITLHATRYPLLITDLLIKTKLASSKSEAKRLVQQKAVAIDQLPVTSYLLPVEIENGMIIKAGKRKYARVQIKVGRKQS